MTAQMQEMLASTAKGLLVNQTSHTLTLSKIFDWYAADFQGAAGSVIDFILPFLPHKTQQYIVDHKAGLSTGFFDYNWDLNGEAPCNCSKSE